MREAKGTRARSRHSIVMVNLPNMIPEVMKHHCCSLDRPHNANFYSTNQTTVVFLVGSCEF